MDAKERSQTVVKGTNQPDEMQQPKAMHVKLPLPGVKLPPITWPPPSIIPGHDTEIRNWGINE